MAIRHLKHEYLIKKQFLEENELITSDFFFFENFRFLASLMGISLVWIYSNIPNAWWKDHNSFSIFFFRFRNLDCRGMLTWCIVATNVNCLDRFFWIRNGLCDVLVKGQSFNQVWTCLVFLARKGSSCPNEGKFLSKERALVRFGLSWNFWPKSGSSCPS